MKAAFFGLSDQIKPNDFPNYYLFCRLKPTMGDSDDEYDRKRRDKFRGEREGRGAGGPERERWPERDR